jgi:hypothetical protein
MADGNLDAGGVLLIHEGELSDVGDVLTQAGIAFDEKRPGSVATYSYLAAPLVISSPPFLLEQLDAGHDTQGPRMAILEGQSRTARSMLARGGIEWMVRRPVHPAALRLLVLHCLYAGPEKRKSTRVSIGAEVSFRSGWRRGAGILQELSERDCRILSKKRISVGGSVKLRVPGEISGGKPLGVVGRVVRTASAPYAKDTNEICLVFDALPAPDLARLRKVVAAHARGPALLRADDPDGLQRRESRRRPSGRSVITIAHAEQEAVTDAAEALSDCEHEPDAAERRGDSRHAFERRVIATDEQATHVLVGRDISLGGMRVNPTPTLAVGDTLQIAVHVPGQETPLVLNVRVARDDGSDGLLLHFDDLSITASGYLKEVLANLPGLAAGDGDSSSGEAPRVVSEILSETLERRAG